MSKILLTTLAIFLVSPFQVQAADPVLTRFSYVEPHMGTRFKILVYAPDETAAQRASQAAFARIAELDGIMSDYRPTSELMRLCQKAGGDPVPVGEDLFLVLSRAQELARRSEGAFDVTVGPLSRLWRATKRARQLPEPEKLAAAKTLVGFDKMKLDDKAHTVQLLKAGMQLDLGGIAKGYAGDAAIAVLKKHGLDRALVAAGGDIVVSGPPPDAEGWTIAIAPLEDPESPPARFLVLKNAAVSTSGDAEQFVELDGKRYSHILDPKTGLGLVGRMSVTVVAPNGITADSHTKVVCVLGPERGLPLLDATPGTTALMVRLTEKGLEVIQSKQFPPVKTRK